MDDRTQTAEKEGRASVARDLLRRCWPLLIPAIALLELGAHLSQTSHVVPEQDWIAARDLVGREVKPNDLIVFAPAWTEPLGRMYFGDALATVARVARPDESRFDRAFEVSIRGQRTKELEGWAVESEEKQGKITMRVYKNPAPAPVIDDVVAQVASGRAKVTRQDRDCVWQAGQRPQTAGTYFPPGVAYPGERYQCSGVQVAATILSDLGYRPRRCIVAPPPVRIHFTDVRFGNSIRGHHGLYAESERAKTGMPVTLVLRDATRSLGTFTHRDGEGWRGFEVDTSHLASTTGELVAEISSASTADRMYCFELTTR